MARLNGLGLDFSSLIAGAKQYLPQAINAYKEHKVAKVYARAGLVAPAAPVAAPAVSTQTLQPVPTSAPVPSTPDTLRRYALPGLAGLALLAAVALRRRGSKK